MKGRPNREIREYAKRRINEIQNHPNYEPNPNYPTDAFKFVAWWDARFGRGEPPANSVVDTEVRARNPQWFDGPIVAPRKANNPTNGLTGVEIPLQDRIGKRVENGIDHHEDPAESNNERTLAERIHGSLRTRAEIETEGPNDSLATRIGGSLAERIGGRIEQRIKPKSLADRIDGGIRKKEAGGKAHQRRD